MAISGTFCIFKEFPALYTYSCLILFPLRQAIFSKRMAKDLERHRYYEINRAVQYGYREAVKSLAFQTRDVKLSLKEIPRYRKRLLKKKK